jgi:hypothetical protein
MFQVTFFLATLTGTLNKQYAFNFFTVRRTFDRTAVSSNR